MAKKNDTELPGEAPSPRVDSWARRRTRRVLMQGLYQWQMTGASASRIEQNLEAAKSLKRIDRTYLRELLGQIIAGHEALDQLIEPVLDRELSQLDKVELAILRLAVFELSERIDVPYRVVIDEAVQLAKEFGAEDSHKYINGVLDKLAKTLRQVETGADGRV